MIVSAQPLFLLIRGARTLKVSPHNFYFYLPCFHFFFLTSATSQGSFPLSPSLKQRAMLVLPFPRPIRNNCFSLSPTLPLLFSSLFLCCLFDPSSERFPALIFSTGEELMDLLLISYLLSRWCELTFFPVIGLVFDVTPSPSSS